MLNLTSRPHGLSQHACKRQQQRAIPTVIVDCLIDFGDVRSAGRGATSHYFTKRSWRKVAAYLGRNTRQFTDYRNTYVIVADGIVVTAAYRH